MSEGVVIAAFKSTGLNGGRFATRIGTTFPAVRVTRVGGPSRPATNTKAPEFQIEVWGGGPEPAHETEAANLADQLEQAVEGGSLLGTYGAARVLGAWMVGGIFHSPDPTTYRERYFFTMGCLIQ